MSNRHRWGEPTRFEHKTERACTNPGCAIVKVTVHPPQGYPWVEFYRGLEKLAGDKTPACEHTSAHVRRLPRRQGAGESPGAVNSNLCPLSSVSTGNS